VIADSELKDVNDTIKQDCARSYSHFEKSIKLGTKESLDAKREELKKVLHVYFSSHKDYSYYQGLNFVAELFCLTYGKNLGYILLERLVELHFKRYMKSEQEFEKNIKDSLNLCLYVLKREVPNIMEILHMNDGENDNVIVSLGFLISMILTWCASRISNENQVFRIYDFMICSKHSQHMESYLIASVTYCFTLDLHRVNSDLQARWKGKFLGYPKGTFPVGHRKDEHAKSS
jgi:hypothetical protein